MPVLPFDLPLASLAESACEDEAFSSVAYATAMQVEKSVLNAELALTVNRIPALGDNAQEPATLALEDEGLFLLRQQLLLELHALGRRDLPWQQKRALLRALQIMGVSSFEAVGEIGNVAAVVDAVSKVAGIGNGGWAAHYRGLVKNGSPLLHQSEALVAHSFSVRWSAAAAAAPVPALPFKESLAVAG